MSCGGNFGPQLCPVCLWTDMTLMEDSSFPSVLQGSVRKGTGIRWHPAEQNQAQHLLQGEFQVVLLLSNR